MNDRISSFKQKQEVNDGPAWREVKILKKKKKEKEKYRMLVFVTPCSILVFLSPA